MTIFFVQYMQPITSDIWVSVPLGSFFLFLRHMLFLPVPAASRSKASVYGRSPAKIVGSNPTAGMNVSVVSVVCCQVEVSATD